MLPPARLAFAPLLLASVVAQSAHAGELDALIVSCAPLVSPVTMGKLVRVESSGHLFAVSDDGPANLPWRQRKRMLRSFTPSTMPEAVAIARRLHDTGHLFGVGPAQVSSRNFARFGLSIEAALDPCTNLRVGSQILTAFYLDARRTRPDPAEAVLAAISAYNTGNFVDGFYNGYVNKVVSAGQGMVPALASRYDSRLPPGPREADFGDYTASPYGMPYGAAPHQQGAVRMVRPPEMLSRKITVLQVSTE
ncbi:lytic transglycosylase domain-containing protein [Burkholderia pseudomallei]|uniref:lytic transglycosylase domain-containing protein n=1 Tax=Burkholderia pseudomallei TaxID=28450 RepID=UPI000A1A2F45|nr:lytic transglycosylase domain-containing protein [Burkholderia pseudomallei]ARL04295.1 hypothetical protein BOC44_21235 [Burkholderia pseudomallei]